VRAFAVLQNSDGIFRASDKSHPAIPGARYGKMVVGDFQNDRFDDVVVLGDKGKPPVQMGEERNDDGRLCAEAG
jgi:hypothetical protein